MHYFDLAHKRWQLWQHVQQHAAACFTANTSVATALENCIEQLMAIDSLWTFPGSAVLQHVAYYAQTQQYALLQQLVNNVVYQLSSLAYKRQLFDLFYTNLERLDRPHLLDHQQFSARHTAEKKPYFEVLIIHPFPTDYELLYRQQLMAFKSAHDEFIYDIVLVSNAEDALTAILANTDIQVCVYLNHLPVTSPHLHAVYEQYTQPLLMHTAVPENDIPVEFNLCHSIRAIRPELNHILISELAPVHVPPAWRAGFDRVLFHDNPFHDLHLAILAGVHERFSTPFFDALQNYSRKPKGVFHALPLSQGASIKNSAWISDLRNFYGDNIFLAETSSTLGGLDSLLDPTGAIKQAHHKTADTFGADHSFFVTNGTSTSNKIVMQANLVPGDIVLVSADCHKSIPYSVMLAGAHPIFLETYPLTEYDLYGGIDLAQIKRIMLDLKQHHRLHRLKQIVLTNSTFDGLIYHAQKYMLEILAIKPDIIFHWDEAWFAFAHFHPLYHGRTAMAAANHIRHLMHSTAYHTFYAQWKAQFDALADEHKWHTEILYPDPAAVKLRVYATQSTHKTLTAFRQGSMIHVVDVCFDAARFLEAFRIHTSTSPNYQIIASLDIARRQAALEGFSRVRESIFLALQLRQQLSQHPLLKHYFTVLDDATLIPDTYRALPLHALAADTTNRDTTTTDAQLAALSQQWGNADFVVDPTRITLDVSKTGIDGSNFRQLLMNRYDIQVNKTSRHTVLFLINIGATQASIDYLVHVLLDMASQFEQEKKIRTVTRQREPSIALPERRIFHEKFTTFKGNTCSAADIRHAYFEGSYDEHTTYIPLSNDTLEQVRQGKAFVSTRFVTPYPPGFPVIVPGQLITEEILVFFQHIKVKEIHGFSFEQGFKVFTDAYLETPHHLPRHLEQIG